MYFINQITQDDCSFTCLKILLANVKHEENYLYLKEDEKHGAYSYQELLDMSKGFGVELIGFKVENKEELKDADPLPMILTITQEDTSHSVYLYKVTNSHVYLLDPNSGKVKMRLKKFFDIWDGTGLLIKETKDCTVDNKTPINKEKNHIFDYVFQFLAGISFLFGLITMDMEDFKIYSIVALGVSVIFEIFARMIKVRQMHKFDNKIAKYLDNIDSKYFDQFLIRKEKYKESVFSNKNNFLYYLFICALIIFSMIVGNPWNLTCALLPVIFALLQSQVFSIKEKKVNNDIEKMEVKFCNSKTYSKVNILFEDIHAKSYKYANYYFLKNAIGTCAFGASAFLSLYFLKSLSFINFLFLLFTEIYLYQNLCSLLSYENGAKEREVCFMKFINILESKK